MRKLNTVILLVLLTIAICNSIAIKKLNDEVLVGKVENDEVGVESLKKI